MRIIGGKHKGFRFRPPAKNWPTRPTTDFAREALFNILTNQLDFEDIRVLDLFGGTGSHSYECISRGCKDVTYVDKHPGCLKFVSEISQQLNMEDHLLIVKSDVFSFIRTAKSSVYDYIFAGPPYGLPQLSALPDLILSQFSLLASGGLFVLEHNQHFTFEQSPYFRELRKYGGTHFTFFRLPD